MLFLVLHPPERPLSLSSSSRCGRHTCGAKKLLDGLVGGTARFIPNGRNVNVKNVLLLWSLRRLDRQGIGWSGRLGRYRIAVGLSVERLFSENRCCGCSGGGAADRARLLLL